MLRLAVLGFIIVRAGTVDGAIAGVGGMDVAKDWVRFTFAGLTIIRPRVAVIALWLVVFEWIAAEVLATKGLWVNLLLCNRIILSIYRYATLLLCTYELTSPPMALGFVAV
jgi:hypothetical protein